MFVKTITTNFRSCSITVLVLSVCVFRHQQRNNIDGVDNRINDRLIALVTPSSSAVIHGRAANLGRVIIM